MRTEHESSQTGPDLRPAIMLEEDAFAILDTFDLDANMPNTIYDHGRLMSPASSNAEGATVSFILGDHLDKEPHFHFLPPPSVIRNGALDDVHLSEMDDCEMLVSAALNLDDMGRELLEVKQESKTVMKRVKPNVVPAMATRIKVTQEKSDLIETMDLLNDNIGEWVAATTSCDLEKGIDFESKTPEENLGDVHYDYSVMKKTKSSRYNGVSKTKSKKLGGKGNRAKFSKYWLGSYVLEVDAALAYDGLVRASGWKKHFGKVNFATEQDYIDAREEELKIRGLNVDLEEALAYISLKVFEAKSQIRRK